MGRKKLYLLLMSVCVTLFVLAWLVVIRVSVTAAVVMSAVAAAIPPAAAILANTRRDF